MKIATPMLFAFSALLATTACQSSEDVRLEGISLGGGNAIAHNTALQVIDPWPAGVQETNLVVPAHRASPAAQSDDEGNEE